MGELFEKHKILHGLPLPGQMVKYAEPSKFAFFKDVIENEKLLKLGNYYTVKKTELNSSSTYVWLDEFWDNDIDEHIQNQKFFNMYAFDWDLPELDLNDLIGVGVRNVCQLNDSYGYGIKFDNEVFYEGEPMLVLEYDEKDIVTKAYYEN